MSPGGPPTDPYPPAWSIGVTHPKTGPRNLLDFSATVWVGGNGPLDVEGFRTNGSPIMKAYQYFWRNGKVIGRARAGTMGFDNKKGRPLRAPCGRRPRCARTGALR